MILYIENNILIPAGMDENAVIPARFWDSYNLPSTLLQTVTDVNMAKDVVPAQTAKPSTKLMDAVVEEAVQDS